MKSFKHWTRQDIADEFGLKLTRKCEDLEHWLSSSSQLSDAEKASLDILKEKLIRYVDIWNEQELIIKFISFIIGMADYDTDYFKSYANRKLKGKIDGKEVSGEVDLMVASGEFEPKQPYFCLHEYKKEDGVNNDPLGQLLIAMLAAQELNNNAFPIYGAYISGRNWFFLTLQNYTYCISSEFVATRNDIYSIMRIMKGLKTIIENQRKDMEKTAEKK
ncbi:MAG: hypothetical protein AAF847_06905 [Bacteroidota bacterium]